MLYNLDMNTKPEHLRKIRRTYRFSPRTMQALDFVSHLIADGNKSEAIRILIHQNEALLRGLHPDKAAAFDTLNGG